MGSWTVSCAACGLRWNRVGNFSDYERQAVESRPCPGCAGYTLVCREPRADGKPLPAPRAKVRLKAAA